MEKIFQMRFKYRYSKTAEIEIDISHNYLVFNSKIYIDSLKKIFYKQTIIFLQKNTKSRKSDGERCMRKYFRVR